MDQKKVRRRRRRNEQMKTWWRKTSEKEREVSGKDEHEVRGRGRTSSKKNKIRASEGRGCVELSITRTEGWQVSLSLSLD